jgi:pimeloyl-ACP methyl ester carboxylesterase
MRWLLALIGLVAVMCGGAYLVLKRADIPYESLATRYESAASRYVDLPGGVRMHYRDEGQGPVIVLIHGFSASLQTWEPWVQRLATGSDRINDYRVITIDLPGHGLTRAPAGYQANMENYRDLLAAFVASQHLTSFALGGNSMGGNVAWEYALAHPDQVNALILVDAAGWPHTENETEPTIFKLLRNPVLGPLLRDLDNTTLTRQGLQDAFADPSHVDDAMVTRYTELSRAPGHREILVDLATGRNGRHPATAERLAALHMPTLILWGANDNLIPASDAQRFHDAIPGSQVVVWDHVGHVPQEESPDQSAMAVHEFLYAQTEGSALAAE